MATDRFISAPRGPVGIAATSPAAVHELRSLLAGYGIDVSTVAGLAPSTGATRPEADRLLAALQALQTDPDTRAIALVSGPLEAEEVTRVLGAIDPGLAKPVIACFLGADRRAVWRSGAIPAARLDEVAMRATAWLRGWDQALISSRLMEADEQLAGQAARLGDSISPGRRRLVALFDDPIFADEARLMLAELAGPGADARFQVEARPQAWQRALRQALADPEAAVLLFELVIDDQQTLGRVQSLLTALAMLSERATVPGPLPSPYPNLEPAQVIVRLCGSGQAGDLAQEGQGPLYGTGAFQAPSNAAAARLAAMILKRLSSVP